MPTEHKLSEFIYHWDKTFDVIEPGDKIIVDEVSLRDVQVKVVLKSLIMMHDRASQINCLLKQIQTEWRLDMIISFESKAP
ncbi:hypothetical protein [Mucilaginibacter sp.]